MKHNGVISKKIELLEEELSFIKSLKVINTEELKRDHKLKRAIERSLQICVEIVIDISNRILSLQGQSPSTASFESLKRLQGLGIIKDAYKYENMIKFRNFVVHRYESINNEELVNICNNHLFDFKNFISEIENAPTQHSTFNT